MIKVCLMLEAIKRWGLTNETMVLLIGIWSAGSVHDNPSDVKAGLDTYNMRMLAFYLEVDWDEILNKLSQLNDERSELFTKFKESYSDPKVEANMQEAKDYAVAMANMVKLESMLLSVSTHKAPGDSPTNSDRLEEEAEKAIRNLLKKT